MLVTEKSYAGNKKAYTKQMDIHHLSHEPYRALSLLPLDQKKNLFLIGKKKLTIFPLCRSHRPPPRPCFCKMAEVFTFAQKKNI